MNHPRSLLRLAPLLLVACGSGGGSTQASDAGRDSPSGSSGDAGKDGAPANGEDSGIPEGSPITATADKWTWVPFPDSACANGSATGIGVNLTGTPGSRVLIYLEGGGACWSDLTCFTLMTAVNFTTGYGETDFDDDVAAELSLAGGFFDRTTAANPFKDYSYVYVPYCTGDIFGGDNVMTFASGTAHFVGYKNMGAYLARLVPTFSDADRIILAGSSAGGFGAALNWWRAQEAFGSIRVDLIDDSGTAVPDKVLGTAGVALAETQSTAWRLTFPPGCTTCATDLSTLYGYYQTALPKQHGALLSYTDDTVLPSFFGITTAEFAQGLSDDLGAYFGAKSNLKAFVNGGAGHVLWFTPQLTTGTTTVQEFITQMVTDDASWATVNP